MIERLVTNDDGLRIALWRDVFIAVWRAVPTMDMADAIARELPAFATRHAGGVVMFNVLLLDGGAGALPTKDVRDRVAADMRRHEAVTRALAVVLLGAGFYAATARAIVTGLLLASRRSAPAKSFSDVEGAVDWLCAKSAVPATLRDEARAAVRAALR